MPESSFEASVIIRIIFKVKIELSLPSTDFDYL